VNNVETLAVVKYVIRDGAAHYRKYGTEKSAGTKLFSLSGNIVKPGNYEVPLAFPLKDMVQARSQIKSGYPGWIIGSGIKRGRIRKSLT